MQLRAPMELDAGSYKNNATINQLIAYLSIGTHEFRVHYIVYSAGA